MFTFKIYVLYDMSSDQKFDLCVVCAIMWWRFSNTIDRTVDRTPQVNRYLSFSMIIDDFSAVTDGDKGFFTWKS